MCAWKIARPKPTLNFQRFSTQRHAEAFLSQAGPRFNLILVQAEHHLHVDSCFSPPKRRRRPLGRPHVELLCAWVSLAHPPLCEGTPTAGPATVGDGLVPVRHRGRGRGRRGKEPVGVDCHQHPRRGCARENSEWFGRMQGIRRQIRTALKRYSSKCRKKCRERNSRRRLDSAWFPGELNDVAHSPASALQALVLPPRRCARRCARRLFRCLRSATT